MRLDDAISCFLQEWPTEGPSYGTVRTTTIHLKWLAGYAIREGRPNLADLTPSSCALPSWPRLGPDLKRPTN